MNSLDKYKEAPYLLTEEDIRSKPLGDIMDLVRHIDKVIAETVKGVAIHMDNAKLIQRVLSVLNEGVK